MDIKSLLIISFILLLTIFSGCMVYEGEYSARITSPSIRVHSTYSVPYVSSSTIYRYHYYPVEQVYFYPDSGTYFWLQGSNWESGLRLPSHYNLSLNTGWLWLDLSSDKPYRYHHQTKRKYPHTFKIPRHSDPRKKPSAYRPPVRKPPSHRPPIDKPKTKLPDRSGPPKFVVPERNKIRDRSGPPKFVVPERHKSLPIGLPNKRGK